MLLSSLLSVVLLIAAPETRPAENPSDLKVMTFNLRYGTADDGENRWELRRDQVFGVIRKQSPDVLGVQEAIDFQLDEVRAALPGYAQIGVSRSKKPKDEYSAILYRADRLKPVESGTFWYSDTPEVPGSTNWGNTLPRICSWAHFEDTRSGTSFYMFNTHLDHQSQPSREKSAQMLARRIADRKTPGAAILTGDFNAGERNPAVRSLVDAPATSPAEKSKALLRDTFRVVHPDEKVAGTFNGFKGETTGQKIDYILVTPDVEVLDAEIIRDHKDDKYPSDHFPVAAKIRLPRKQ